MAKATPARPPGRPKDGAKRQAIVDAAQHLFVTNAYESVTMDHVASRAGVAKMTVYGHFHDKETLFEAVVRAHSDVMVAALPALPRRGGDLEDELVVFGQTFLKLLLCPDVVNAMHRNIEMLARNPALAKRVYNAGPGTTRTMLATYIMSAAGWQARSPEEGSEVASDLMSLWLGDMQQRLALGLAAPITDHEIMERVRRGTRLFLRAYGLLPADVTAP